MPPAAPRGGTALGWLMPAWLSLMLALSVLGFSNGAQGADQRAMLGPTLAAIDRFLTLPFPAPEPSDIRDAALPLACVGLLVWGALARNASGPRGCWIDLLAAAGLALAAISISFNHSSGISGGWWWQYACGLLVALLLMRAQRDHVRRIVAAAALVAAVAMALSFYHRHALGLRYFRWPIGPLTVVAAFGAIWGAAAAGYLGVALAGWSRPMSRTKIALALLMGSAAIGMTLLCGRRGALLALLVAVAATTALALIGRIGSAQARRALIALLVAVSVCGGGYVAYQASSARREVSGSLDVRFAYWRFIASRLPEVWPLGAGPDRFVCDSTTGLARQRAETPHRLHGTLEPAAHNEWLQALYELGLFGGGIYIALPLIAAIGLSRRLLRGEGGATEGLLLAALIALGVNESASINLRYNNLPAWYWTLIGLALATAPPRRWIALPLRPLLVRVFLFAVALVLTVGRANQIWIAGMHTGLRKLVASGSGGPPNYYFLALGRAGAVQSLAVGVDFAAAWENFASARARRTGVSEDERAQNKKSVVDAWQQVYDACPAYPDVAGRLATALVGVGDESAARAVVERHLAQVNPYDPAVNLLAARRFASTPAAKLDYLVHGLREGAATAELVEIAKAAIAAGRADEWAKRVAAARDDLRQTASDAWRDPLAPEVLRLEAAVHSAAKERDAAYAAQFTAARAYSALETGDDPRRRRSEAEQDAWTQAADYRFRSDPARIVEALDHVRQAERAAVLGIAHEALATPDPQGEYVGGQIVPTELPDRLIPLWRLSALLRLGACEMHGIELRLYSALPAAYRTKENGDRLMADLARELLATFGLKPPAGMSAEHFARLVALAKQPGLKR